MRFDEFRVIKSSIFALSCLLILISCKNNSQLSEEQGLGVKGATWPNNEIPVCWKLADFPKSRLAISKHIATEFSRTLVKVTPQPWPICGDKKKAVLQIEMRDHSEKMHGYVTTSGTARVWFESEVKLGESPTLVLNKKLFNDSNISPLLLNTALHEFGHVAGLLHEHDRKDAPKDCKEHLENPPSSEDSTALTAKDNGLEVFRSTQNFDNNSVMNYCFLDDMEKKGIIISLSAGDIATISMIVKHGRNQEKRSMSEMFSLFKLKETACDKAASARFYNIIDANEVKCVKATEDLPAGNYIYNPLTGSIR